MRKAKQSLESRARAVWCNPSMLGKRVHVSGVGCGELISARSECLGFGIALESGGVFDAEASWLTLCDEQY